MARARWSRSTRRSLHAHAPLASSDPLRQAGREADPGETGRAPYRSGNARNLVRFKSQRPSLALAIRAAQSSRRGSRQARRGGERRARPHKRARWWPRYSRPRAPRRFRPRNCPRDWSRRSGLGRNSWPSGTIRQLADAFLAHANGRKKSPAFEARWLNLCGFCLRPGFGFPGDEYRIEQARRVYAGGPAIRQPDSVRDRLVDFRRAHRRRPQPQPAGGRLPAPLARSCCRAATRSSA